jgi:arginine decarboxylase
LRDLLGQGEYDQLRKLTAGITRTLAQDTHRASVPAGGDQEPGGRAGPSAGPGQPKFEVLVVSGMPSHEEEALRHELLRLRQPEDHFSYDIVVVPSLKTP